MAWSWFWVASGGACGSLLRWWVSLALSGHRSVWPFATIAVNLTGSLIFGAVAGALLALPESSREPWRLCVLVGVLGGFTTFSTLSWDTLKLLEDGKVVHAVISAMGQVVIGTLACWAGWSLVRSGMQ